MLDAMVLEEADGVSLRIKVVPNASRTKIVGVLGDRLKVSVAAPPEGGKANKMLETLIAKTLGVAKKQVAVVSGHTQPQKRVHITGVEIADAVAVLRKYI